MLTCEYLFEFLIVLSGCLVHDYGFKDIVCLSLVGFHYILAA